MSVGHLIIRVADSTHKNICWMQAWSGKEKWIYWKDKFPCVLQFCPFFRQSPNCPSLWTVIHGRIFSRMFVSSALEVRDNVSLKIKEEGFYCSM